MGGRTLCLLLGLCLHGAAWSASSVTLSGILGDKALLSIAGGAPKVMRVGETYRSVRLVEVLNNQVVVEEEGRRRTIPFGFSSVGGGVEREQAKNAVLYSDGRGHFIASGRVNGTEVNFVVDTGASLVTLPKSLASRAGVALDTTRSTLVSTAGGVVKAWPVQLNKVVVGGISLHLVDAVVLEDNQLPVALLGMSFLNRTDMTREGQVMTLKQRY